jgi:hypothetical protein
MVGFRARANMQESQRRVEAEVVVVTAPPIRGRCFKLLRLFRKRSEVAPGRGLGGRGRPPSFAGGDPIGRRFHHATFSVVTTNRAVTSVRDLV